VAPLAIENVQLTDWTYFEYGGPPPSTGPIDAIGNVLDNVLGGNSEANLLSGLGGTDTLSGGSGNDVLDGGAGADHMTGGGGDDTFYVDDLGDQVYDTDFWSQTFQSLTVGGNDTVYSSVSIVLLSVTTTRYVFTPDGQVAVTLELNSIESLVLTGTANLDATGNGSANTLQGNAGANVLEGRGGADSFVFTTALGPGNIDTIADFVRVDDTIVLDDAVFAGLGPGALAAGAFRIGAAADANDRIIYDSATGELLFDIDGVGGAAAVHFATLSGAPTLAANDFLVV
jgi:serralysin